MLIKFILSMMVLTASIVVAQQSEKELFKKSYAAIDFRMDGIVAKPGKGNLQVWQPFIDHIKTLTPSMQRVMKPELESLEVDYDEIWTYVDERYFTASEIKDNAGKLNIYKAYWKDGRFLALTQEKQFLGNPKTDEKFTNPCHQITNIYGREAFFKLWFDTPQSLEDEKSDAKTEENKAEKEVKKHNKVFALSAAQEAVRSRLKAPKTAKFQFGGGKAWHIGDGVYEVNSYVDSENSFSAVLRKYYYVKVKVFDFNDYTILELNTWD